MLRLTLGAGLMVIILAMACAGGSGPKAKPWLGLSSTRGLILYSEPLTGDIVAMDIDSGRQLRRPPASEDFTIAVDCTPDGHLAVRAGVDYADEVSRLLVTGEGAPDGPVKVQGIVQGVTWSPDGRRIALSSYDSRTATSGLWLADVATGQVSSLPAGPGPAGPLSWSPDGKQLLFTATQGNDTLVYALEIGQAEPVQLFARSGAFESDWSPDGKTLVFSAADANSQFQLFEVNADGSGEKQLTASDTSKASPRWSEDGSTIAFAATILVPQVSRVAVRRHNLAVWLVNADGTGERSLTDVALDAWPLAWCRPGPWLEGWTEK